MKEYQEILNWADSLTECGKYGEVGAQMIGTIKEKLREAYRQGRKDESAAVQARRSNPVRRVRGR